jgi:hypothetical protein
MIVSDEEHKRRIDTNQIHFFNRELCTYGGGYVDGKYTSMKFINQVKEKGSEPARFAFAGSRILFSKIDGLEETLQQVTQYPSAGKAERINRFYAYPKHGTGTAGSDPIEECLLGTSVSKLILFSGRLILAHNEILYPYHKWFLRVLEEAKETPDGLLEYPAVEHSADDREHQALFEKVKTFQLDRRGVQLYPHNSCSTANSIGCMTERQWTICNCFYSPPRNEEPPHGVISTRRFFSSFGLENPRLHPVVAVVEVCHSIARVHERVKERTVSVI